MVDQAYLIVLAKSLDLSLMLQIRSYKQVQVASVISQRFRMISEGNNPCQHERSVTQPWIVAEIGTEIRVRRRSLQEFLKKPSNQPFKSRRAQVEFMMKTLRPSRQTKVERRVSSASKVNNIRAKFLSTDNK